MNRERRYRVLKQSDIDSSLSNTEKEILQSLVNKIDMHRFGRGKLCLACVVVESDWPEFEPTWSAIEKRVDADRKLTGRPDVPPPPPVKPVA